MVASRIDIVSNIQEQVYAALKSDIVNGKIDPGTQLKEVELSEAFGVSRSPIREALRRLCGDGLIDLHPNSGMFVKEFSMDYVKDLLKMRMVMESSGMRNDFSENDQKKLCQFIEKISKAAKESDDMDLQSHMDIDAELHSFFNSLNHNSIMDETWERMSQVNIMVQRLSLKDKRRAKESQKEHLAVLKLLADKKIEEAIKMNEKHLDHTRKAVEIVLNTHSYS